MNHLALDTCNRITIKKTLLRKIKNKFPKTKLGDYTSLNYSKTKDIKYGIY